MASKRNLYRPAQVEENVGMRKPRKTLAQGRLITNGAVPHGGISVTGSPNAREHLPAGGRQRANLSVDSSQLHHTSLTQGRLEESVFSPRRCVPRVSEPLTPDRGPPATSLDLTDSEFGEETSDMRSRYQKPDEVLCVDASRQTLNPDVSEVDIRLGIDKSPVKIVCHSPSRIKHTLMQQNSPHSPGSLRQSKNRTPVIQKEVIHDDHIEPYTAVQSIPMTPPPQDRRPLQSLHTNYPQPDFNDTDGMDSMSVGDKHSLLDENDDKHSVISENDDASLKDYVVTNHKLKDKAAKEKMLSASKKDKLTLTGKKKKGTIIPSRYMQAVESKAKASLIAKTDKSHEKSKLSRSHKSARKVSAKHPANRNSNSLTARPQTPENQSVTSTGGKTSTPTMDGSYELEIDASAIHPDVSVLAGKTSGSARSKSRLQRDLTDELMGQSVLSNVSVCNQSTMMSKRNKKLDLKTAQQQLDCQYMNYLQWAFLAAKAKKTFKEQEKQAMAQIHGVYKETEKLLKVKAEKEQHLARIQHTNMADHLAEVQRQCLGPVVNSLPNLQKQYSSLAYALDTTRHQIPTHDIHLPENEEEFQAKMQAQLLESERLLGELKTLTETDAPTVAKMSNSMVALDHAVREMEEELKKSNGLLAATQCLTLRECSLRVQDLQLQETS